ncbi:acetyltransferase [Candidatus Planktophila sulfonica]|uniref:Acetyltransferase n=1 Tax=Candidatus Planktophila sulfonica TaxID=1884904 RepID=A0A249KFU8_9ACTN|nr:GNAT family N-acetyltransferase [Candidatus Planktophila sulfonica]ASY15616.1 acetyltransferase [Candidatus Planktophila sulfonica]
MYEKVIDTPRLELHHISAQGIIELYENKDDVIAIAGRDFTNPHQNLVIESGPLGWRVPQVKVDPSVNKWFVRFIVLKESKEIIGSTSFHGVPDSEGMMEIGLGIEEAFQGNGYAKEALKGMWSWVCTFPEVKTLRYTVSPNNLPSIAVINYFGFDYKGQQIDEEDGPENIYEMSTSEFKSKWGKQ